MMRCRRTGTASDALHYRHRRYCACRRRSGAPISFEHRPCARACGAASPTAPVERRRGFAFAIGRDCAQRPRPFFDVDGRVNGRRIDFVVDTGASVVALTARDAARLGIHPSRNAFVADVKTANGTVRAAPARLDVVQIGSLELRDVTALVLPDDALSDNLLGLSFLSRLHRFEYSDGRLVLEQ
jgi:aspartyl protease family protein